MPSNPRRFRRSYLIHLPRVQQEATAATTNNSSQNNQVYHVVSDDEETRTEISIIDVNQNSGGGIKESEVGEDLYKNHQLQKNWTTHELVENVRVVGGKMGLSGERIDEISTLFKLNKIDGFVLSLEDEKLSSFSANVKLPYGTKMVVLEMLKKMGLAQMKKSG